MTEKNIFSRRTAMFVSWLIVALGLVGCGGGGGGGGGDSLLPLGDAKTEAVALNVGNAGNAAAFGLSLGDLVLALAHVDSNAVRALVTDPSPVVSRSCSNGGVVQYTWADLDGDGQRGVGDKLSIQYKDCAVAEVASIMRGTVVISVTAKGDGSHSLSIDHGAGLLLVDQSDQSESHVFGTFNVAWRDDGMTNRITLSSSANDDLRLAASYQNETGKLVEDTERLQQIDIHKTLSREHARSSTKLSFKLVSFYLGGSVTVSTPVELSGYLDTFPDQGEMAIRGAGLSVARLKPNFALNSNLLSYELDANGDGQTEDKGSAGWDDLTTGIMWWAESLGAQPAFIAHNTRSFSSTNFSVIKSSYQAGLIDQSQPMSIQFSRELAQGGAPRHQLRRSSGPVDGQYFWGSAIVPVTVQVKGAYVTLKPAEPLQHGLKYVLEPIGSTSEALVFKDTLGNTIITGAIELTVHDDLHAVIALSPNVAMIAPSQSLTVSAASSRSAGNIVSYRWSQIDGDSLMFSDPAQANTTVTLSGPVSGGGTATVQLQITDANGEVEYDRETISILPDLTQTTLLYLRSQPGEYVSQGKTGLYTSVTGVFAENTQYVTGAQASYVYSVPGSPGQWWSIFFGGNNGLLHVGSYDNAVRGPLRGSANGLEINGNGNGCNEIAGRFDVLDVARDSAGKVTRLAVDFEQRCDGGPALFGSFRLNSSLPVRP